MGIPLFQVDAFTDSPFSGNPAAVCLLPGPRTPDWMQDVAGEMNLSETAFLVRQPDGYSLRWFTPTVEVDLCGHATLASGHVLWEMGELAPDQPARFHTRSGLLTCRKQGEMIAMDFPAKKVTAVDPPAGLLEALKSEARWVGKNAFDYLVELDSESAVRERKPDLARLEAVEARGIIITSRADGAPRHSAYDFVSRFFAPRAGVPEDPVTGSAHCALAPFWADRLGRPELVGRQVSSRGGTVRVRVDGERVWLSGQAVTVLRGELIAAGAARLAV